jgi:preprotein translocase subunit SecB
MEVTHEAFFSIPEGFETNDEDLAAFGSISVFFMVFPYIRETLQGLTVNAGVPVLLLKPFKLPVNPADVGLPATPAPPVASELSPPASS